MLDWNFIASQIATIAFDIVYFGAIIGTIVVIILDNRNPVKTMAWILILMFLPIVGLVFYFFFGRSQRRVRMIGKKSYSRLLKKLWRNIWRRTHVRFPSITVVSYPCSVIQPGFPLRWKPGGSLYPGALHAAILATRTGESNEAYPHGILYL